MTLEALRATPTGSRARRRELPPPGVLLALAVSTVLNVLYFLYAAILLWLPEQQERLPAGAGAGRLSMQAAAAPAALAILNLLVGLQPSALTQFLQQGMELFCK